MAIGIGRRQFISAIGGATVAWPLTLRTQQGVKRVGVLMLETEGSSDTNARVALFETTLKELGWTPGLNLQIDYRWGMGDFERTREFIVLDSLSESQETQGFDG
jgi:putative ABC transport system substrate-binding protein